MKKEIKIIIVTLGILIAIGIVIYLIHNFTYVETIHEERITADLRMAEIRDMDVNNDIVHMGYRNKTDIVSITLRPGSSCKKWEVYSNCKVFK